MSNSFPEIFSWFPGKVSLESFPGSRELFPRSRKSVSRAGQNIYGQFQWFRFSDRACWILTKIGAPCSGGFGHGMGDTGAPCSGGFGHGMGDTDHR